MVSTAPKTEWILIRVRERAKEINDSALLCSATERDFASPTGDDSSREKMRIRGGRERYPLIPSDVESSTLHPPINFSNISSFLGDEQDALVLGTGEEDDDYTTKGLLMKNPVANTAHRKCGSDDPSSEIAADTDSSISSSSSHVGGRWVEEDKDLPLKKRRLVETELMMMKGKGEPMINNISSSSTIEEELKNSNQTRPKRKRTEKIWTDYVLQMNWVSENNLHHSNNKSSSIRDTINNTDEIIRCSRHNGKGWRCSSPAVAGHNLCDHHLTEQKKKSSKKS